MSFSRSIVLKQTNLIKPNSLTNQFTFTIPPIPAIEARVRQVGNYDLDYSSFSSITNNIMKIEGISNVSPASLRLDPPGVTFEFNIITAQLNGNPESPGGLVSGIKSNSFVVSSYQASEDLTTTYTFNILNNGDYNLTISFDQILKIQSSYGDSPSFNKSFRRVYLFTGGDQQILLRADTDYYGGENLSQSVMIIEDTIPHFSSEILASCSLPHRKILCTDNIIKINSTKYQSSYTRYPNLTSVVIDMRSCKNSLQEEFCNACTLVEKCIDISSTEVYKGPLDILYGLVLYGLLRYFLGFLMYGCFNINILLRKYTVKFFDDLAVSRYSEFINAFNDPLINGFDKYFKYDLIGKC